MLDTITMIIIVTTIVALVFPNHRSPLPVV